MITHDDAVETRTIKVDQRPVCCRVLAPEPDMETSDTLTLPVLLLHGLGCSADAWGPTLTALAVQRIGQAVYAPDLPGYGNSLGPREALGMAELADWAVRLMDSLGIARAHLAGNSMGCQVALEIARRHPTRVGGLMLIGPTTGSRRVPYWRYMVGLALDGFREPLRYNMVLLKMYAQMGLRRYLATVAKMREDEPMDYAREIAAPCLVLRGEHDRIVPERVARELASKLRQGTFCSVPGAAHALQYHAPEQLAPPAVAFWRESEAARLTTSPS